MKKFFWILSVIFAVTLLWLPAAAAGDEVTVNRRVSNDTDRGYGTKINGLTLEPGRWTGWIKPGQDVAVCFDISLTWAATHDVTMRCESSDNPTIADGAGFDMHSQDIAAGTGQSAIYTLSYLVDQASRKWVWCVDMEVMPHLYLQCYFDDSKFATTDTIVVRARGITP